jgi:hypothetical protein
MPSPAAAFLHSGWLREALSGHTANGPPWRGRCHPQHAVALGHHADMADMRLVVPRCRVVTVAKYRHHRPAPRPTGPAAPLRPINRARSNCLMHLLARIYAGRSSAARPDVIEPRRTGPAATVATTTAETRRTIVLTDGTTLPHDLVNDIASARTSITLMFQSV